jgi:hypothetical protein
LSLHSDFALQSAQRHSAADAHPPFCAEQIEGEHRLNGERELSRRRHDRQGDVGGEGGKACPAAAGGNRYPDTSTVNR